jgi:hypothetical protein
MNVAVRAHRILAALANYQKAEHVNDVLAKLADAHLGQLIGCYRNPAPQDEEVGIFSSGLAWFHNGHVVAIPFVEITEVTLPNGKESEGLLLTVQDGRQLQLPIRGQRGRFFDSLAVLRFLDRVMKDLQAYQQSSIPQG